MTPDKRLNQLEPVVADIAQKQDRLIGQMGAMAGELAIVKNDVTEVKTNTSQLRADVIRIEKKADTTAAGLANLTIEVRQGFERVDNRLNSIEGDVSTLKSDVSTLKSDVSTLKSDVSTLKSDVSTLKSDVIVLKADVSEIKQTQRLILTILQERLK